MIKIVKAKCLLFQNQLSTALKVADEKLDIKLSKKNKSTLAAIKAEIFSRQNKTDSARYYLEKALSYKVNRYYKHIWMLELEKFYALDDVSAADYFFIKLAYSNAISRRIKIQAHLERIRLNEKEVKARIAASKNLLKNGYTLGNEW